MYLPSQNPCQASRNRSNRDPAGTSTLSSQSHPTAPFTTGTDTGLAAIDEGSVAIGQGSSTSSPIDRVCSGQSPATASHYQMPDHKILFSRPLSSATSTTATATTATSVVAPSTNALSPTTFPMLSISIPSSSISAPTLSSSPPSSTGSSASLSGPSTSSSLTSNSSFSSIPPFEIYADRAEQHCIVIACAEDQDYQLKQPLRLSGLSSERFLQQHQRQDKGQQGSSQAENSTSPDQQQQSLQSQHHQQQHSHLQTIEAPQEPSHHPSRADCQSHFASSSSPRPPPILVRRSPAVIFPSISCSIHSTHSTSSSPSTPFCCSSPTSSLSPSLSCSAYSYRSNPSPLSPSTATDTDPLLQYTLSTPSPTSATPPCIITPSLFEQRSQSALSPSLSSLPFCGSPFSSSVFSTSFTAESTTSTSLSCAYSQPFLTVPSSPSCLDTTSPRSATLRLRTSTSLLQTLDSLSPQPPSLNTMTRQRSQSASSAQQFSKSPRSPTALLATTADMYDPQQPPKTLQDILLLAQSHYISHRYVQALSLYKLAAERHHSIPACSSLYALYISTQTGSGLVRSDTKAALILIHALRIWTARRWSITTRLDSNGGSVRSRTQDDHDELGEYFAHPRKQTRPQKQQQLRRSLSTGATVSFRRSAKEQFRVVPGNNNKSVVAQSMESEYRHPQFLNWKDEEAAVAAKIHNECEGSVGESENSEDNSEDDDSDSEGGQSDLDTDQDESDSSINDDDEDDEDDEEQEKEEEARRLGLATGEIEDIIQKICHMIQKGVLGLDEPVLVEAASMLRIIERGLHQESVALKAERARSVSLFTSSLSGGHSEDSSVAARPALLLTQGIDLSFLDLVSPDDNGSSPLAQDLPMSRSIRQHPGRSFTSPTPLTTSHDSSSLVSPTLPKHTPMNASITKLSTKEQDTDHMFACAIRIRVMFTLGWVHQQKGEYHYGAQAYGVCSEIPSTRKRLLDSLQHQANVQRWTCKAFEHKAQEKPGADQRRRMETGDKEEGGAGVGLSLEIATSATSTTPTRIENKRSTPAAQSPPSRNTMGSSASSVFTSSQPSTAGSHRHHNHHRNHHRPDISSPSSLSSSESESVSTSVLALPSSVSAVSSFSAIWSSGLFKSGSRKSSSPTAASPLPQDEPKCSPARLKIRTVLGPPAAIEPKDEKDRHHQRGRTTKSDHHHNNKQRGSSKAQATALPTLTMTMTGHQYQINKCGHCGQKRALMPLCVCKKVRYCGLECRLAHLETHRSTCCHLSSPSGLAGAGVGGEVGGGAMGNVDPSFSVAPSACGVAL